MKTLTADDITFHLTRKRIKRVNLRVRANGEVHVSAPSRVPEDNIIQFVRTNRAWILENQAQKLSTFHEKTSRWHTGGSVYPWGEELPIHVVRDAPSKKAAFAEKVPVRTIRTVNPNAMGPADTIEPRGHVLLVHVSRKTEDEDLESEVKRVALAWLDELLEDELPDIFERYERRMGVRALEWRLKRMSSRWGSCNVRTHVICINSILAERPRACLESVVVHELCHLIEPSHNARFHGLMNAYYPDWPRCRRILRGLPPIK